jgi:hypothetical protein
MISALIADRIVIMNKSLQTLTAAQEALLPVDKHDDKAVLHLTNLPISQLEPLIPQLLTWLQDENWPIFGPVRDLLIQHPKEIIEPVRDVLRGNDGWWINNCLVSLVACMPKECQTELEAEIERVARHPTLDEKEFESEKAAEEILKGSGVGDEG